MSSDSTTSIPKGIKIENHGSQLIIHRSWQGAETTNRLMMAIFWNVITFFLFFVVFSSSGRLSFFPLLIMVIGLYLFYSALAGFLNTTTITLMPDTLEMTYGPLPIPSKSNKELLLADLALLRVERVKRRHNNRTRYSYALRAVMRDKQEITLIGGLQKPQQLEFIRGELHRFLNTH